MKKTFILSASILFLTAIIFTTPSSSQAYQLSTKEIKVIEDIYKRLITVAEKKDAANIIKQLNLFLNFNIETDPQGLNTRFNFILLPPNPYESPDMTIYGRIDKHGYNKALLNSFESMIQKILKENNLYFSSALIHNEIDTIIDVSRHIGISIEEFLNNLETCMTHLENLD